MTSRSRSRSEGTVNEQELTEMLDALRLRVMLYTGGAS